MPRSIETGSNDVKHLTWQFHLKTWIYKSEACSMPNQRPPNSLHHENALLSDLVINETPKASNATHTSMALEKRTPNTTHPRSSRIAPARMRWQFNQARRDAKTPIREIAEKKERKKKKKKTALPLFHQKTKKTNLHRSSVPAYTHNLMTAFDISVELRHLFQKKLDRFRSVLWPHTHLTDMIHLEWQFVSNVDN